jgi:uncharacterized protein YqcC (DUF446 family)
MPDPYATLASQLDALAAELQRLGLWDDAPPEAEALNSSAPFCHDTLAFHQWLQWVFIPRARQLIAHRAPLPGECNIAPMAEVSYAEAGWNSDELIELLRAIDQGFTALGQRQQ